MLDTLASVETPEGVALTLRTAGAIPRSAAWGVDFAIRCLLLTAVSTVLVVVGGEAGQGLMLLALFVVFWGYNVLFEVLNDGQTLGKRAFGLRVVNANGTPVGWLASTLRNLLRTADMLPFAYGAGLVASLFDAQGRRFGDMVARTLVIHVSRPAPNAPAIPAQPVPLPFALPLGDRTAIVAFSERAALLTPERRRELAAHLPMLTGADGDDAVARLLGMAADIEGRR